MVSIPLPKLLDTIVWIAAATMIAGMPSNGFAFGRVDPLDKEDIGFWVAIVSFWIGKIWNKLFLESWME